MGLCPKYAQQQTFKVKKCWQHFSFEKEKTEYIFRKISNNIIKPWKTHQTQCFGGRRVSTNNSSCVFPPWGWSQIIFCMDIWGLTAKTCAKMTSKVPKNCQMQKQEFSILKVSPTGLGPSWLDASRHEAVDSRRDFSVRARKVCFTIDLLLR